MVHINLCKDSRINIVLWMERTYGQMLTFPSSYPLFSPKICKCFSSWLWWNGDIVSSDFSVWEVSSTSGKNAFLLFWKRKTQLLPNCLLLSPFRGPWVKGILGDVSDHFHSCITASANMLHIVQRHWTTERLSCVLLMGLSCLGLLSDHIATIWITWHDVSKAKGSFDAYGLKNNSHSTLKFFETNELFCAANLPLSLVMVLQCHWNGCQECHHNIESP